MAAQTNIITLLNEAIWQDEANEGANYTNCYGCEKTVYKNACFYTELHNNEYKITCKMY